MSLLFQGSGFFAFSCVGAIVLWAFVESTAVVFTGMIKSDSKREASVPRPDPPSISTNCSVVAESEGTTAASVQIDEANHENINGADAASEGVSRNGRGLPLLSADKV